MTLLITGGNGFVMSHLARAWLQERPGERLVLADASPMDEVAQRFFAKVRARLDFVRGDVTDPALFAEIGRRFSIHRIVHGATITPINRTVPGETKTDPERERAPDVVAVNVMGTVNALEFARAQPGFERFVYVSSGAVYAEESPIEPMPEEGALEPEDLYGVSKLASERIVSRYADLFGLSTVAVRLASVFGPMDRTTGSRAQKGHAWRIAHLAAKGETIRVHAPEAIGDFIFADDVAAAIANLLDLPQPKHREYNVSTGIPVAIAEMIGHAHAASPQMRVETVPPDRANVIGNPARRTGSWGAYDNRRLREETGWSPRPLKDAMADYVDWIRREERP